MLAPSSESTVEPARPPTRAPSDASRGHPRAMVASAMNTEPPIAATTPGADTPPDVPVGTGRQVNTERGSLRDSVPISVAHVSDAAAASAPTPIARQPSQ